MSSDSTSSTSTDDPNPNNSIEHQLASTSLTGHADQLTPSIQESRNGVDFASASEGSGSNQQEIENSVEQESVDVAEEELRRNSDAAGGFAEVEEELRKGSGRGGVVWMRTNPEVEVEMDSPSSPSSSGYAGERGSSASSGGVSGIDEVVGDEIQEARNDAIDGVLDSQASWVPGKRHVDEVFHFGNTFLVNCFVNFI